VKERFSSAAMLIKNMSSEKPRLCAFASGVVDRQPRVLISGLRSYGR